MIFVLVINDLLEIMFNDMNCFLIFLIKEDGFILLI